jgi:predicted kinase
MKRVIILQGVSGSGKSTYIKNNCDHAEVCSADHYFMVDGEYKFDPSKLGKAHQACFRGFVEWLQDLQSAVDLMFVDNTNTTVAEVAPYYFAAEAYGAEVKIVYLECDSEIAAQRNAHSVPLRSVQAMEARLNCFADRMPPWWNRKVIKTS